MVRSTKRRYRRFIVENMGIHAKAVLAQDAELLNVSTSGACILSRKSLKLGENCLITLKREGTTLLLQCTVVWGTLCGSEKISVGEIRPLYKTGLTFGNLPSDKLIQLKDFLRVSGFPSEGKLSDQYGPSALRFGIQVNNNACLYYPNTSEVKKLSLGGMLMEFYDRLPVEERLPMALFLPSVNRALKFRGRVASCTKKEDRHSNHFDVGIEFLGMTENVRSKVAGFLTHLATEETSKGSPLVGQ